MYRFNWFQDHLSRPNVNAVCSVYRTCKKSVIRRWLYRPASCVGGGGRIYPHPLPFGAFLIMRGPLKSHRRAKFINNATEKQPSHFSHFLYILLAHLSSKYSKYHFDNNCTNEMEWISRTYCIVSILMGAWITNDYPSPLWTCSQKDQHLYENNRYLHAIHNRQIIYIIIPID